MKWIVILLIAAAACWAYFNVDMGQFKQNSTQTFKQEKNLKKFFQADEMNKKETQEVIDTF